jgi:hypothetical protein
MTFRRKKWNDEGKCVGTEDIGRRQPYEGFQAPA